MLIGLIWQAEEGDFNPESEKLAPKHLPPPIPHRPNLQTQAKGRQADMLLRLYSSCWVNPVSSPQPPALARQPCLSLPLHTALQVPMATSSSAPGRRAGRAGKAGRQREREMKRERDCGGGEETDSKGVLNYGGPMRAKPGDCVCRILIGNFGKEEGVLGLFSEGKTQQQCCAPPPPA